MTNRERMLNKCKFVFDDLGIEYTVDPRDNGWVMYFPWCDGDIACHDYTYGGDNDVETYRFPWDNDDVSVLDVDTAIIKISLLHARV